MTARRLILAAVAVVGVSAGAADELVEAAEAAALVDPAAVRAGAPVDESAPRSGVVCAMVRGAALGAPGAAEAGVVASTGPVLLGALHDATDDWTVPLLVLLGLLVPMAWTGWGAARDAVLGRSPRA